MTGWFGEPPGGWPPVTVIGYDGSDLSAEAAAAVAGAGLVVGGSRHLAALMLVSGVETVIMGNLDAAVARIVAARSEGRPSVVLASGDPGFFGIVRRLTTGRDPIRVTVLPARSSVATAFGRLGVPWDDAVVVSAHGRPLRPVLNVLRRFAGTPQRVAVLTDADSSPARIVEDLGDDCPALHVFERLGEPDERHSRIDRDDVSRKQAREHAWEAPNLVVTAEADVQPAAPWLLGEPGYAPEQWALPDDAFLHRDGMLTKRDVRAVVLARLAPRRGCLIWDVGAGSGSVAVECARLGAAAIAIEQDPERNFLADNAGPWNVKLVRGSAPEALVGLPQPDAVFVGGGGPEVVAAVAAVRPERVVVALATLERVAPTVAALQGYDVDTVMLQVSHLHPLGEGHRLAPANPVFVISGVLP